LGASGWPFLGLWRPAPAFEEANTGVTVVEADRFTLDSRRERARETGDAAASIPFLKRFSLFIAGQCEGLRSDQTPFPAPEAIIPAAGAIIAAVGAVILLSASGRMSGRALLAAKRVEAKRRSPKPATPSRPHGDDPAREWRRLTKMRVWSGRAGGRE
jgi:hypothetical protein